MRHANLVGAPLREPCAAFKHVHAPHPWPSIRTIDNDGLLYVCGNVLRAANVSGRLWVVAQPSWLADHTSGCFHHRRQHCKWTHRDSPAFAERNSVYWPQLLLDCCYDPDADNHNNTACDDRTCHGARRLGPRPAAAKSDPNSAGHHSTDAIGSCYRHAPVNAHCRKHAGYSADRFAHFESIRLESERHVGGQSQ